MQERRRELKSKMPQLVDRDYYQLTYMYNTTTIASSNTDGTVKQMVSISLLLCTTVHILIHQVHHANHVANLNAGSGTVRVNSIAVARIGDSADLGAMTSGSGNVFAG